MLLTCAPISELPSNISSMKGYQHRNVISFHFVYYIKYTNICLYDDLSSRTLECEFRWGVTIRKNKLLANFQFGNFILNTISGRKYGEIFCTWYLYQMVTQIQVRTKKQSLLFDLFQAFDNRSHNSGFLHACTTCSELPSNISMNIFDKSCLLSMFPSYLEFEISCILNV